MSKARWSKFWWDDWSADLALKSCSLSARGLWMEMLTIMHKSEDEGYFLVAGRSVSPRQLSGLVSAPEKEVVKCMAELEENRVFSKTEDGIIYSRRMLRDKASREQAREWGSSGGNPDLKGGSSRGDKGGGGGGVNPPVKPSDNGGVNIPDNGSLNLQEAKKLEAKKAEKKDTPKPPRGRVSDDDPHFSEFWAIYPRKDDKGIARTAWAKALKIASPEQIIEGVRGYSFDPNPRWHHKAHNWLTGECWLQASEAPKDGMDPVLRAAGVTQEDIDRMFGKTEEQPENPTLRFLQ